MMQPWTNEHLIHMLSTVLLQVNSCMAEASAATTILDTLRSGLTTIEHRMAEAQGSSIAEAKGRSMAEAKGRSMAEAKGRSMAEAKGRSMAEASAATTILDTLRSGLTAIER